MSVVRFRRPGAVSPEPITELLELVERGEVRAMAAVVLTTTGQVHTLHQGFDDNAVSLLGAVELLRVDVVDQFDRLGPGVDG